MEKDKLEHNLTDHQIRMLVSTVNSQKIHISTTLEVIKAYIFDRTGKVIGQMNPNPLLTFEKVATVAINYFKLIGDSMDFTTPNQSFSYSYSVNGEEGDSVNFGEMDDATKEKLRKMGVMGI